MKLRKKLKQKKEARKKQGNLHGMEIARNLREKTQYKHMLCVLSTHDSTKNFISTFTNNNIDRSDKKYKIFGTTAYHSKLKVYIFPLSI